VGDTAYGADPYPPRLEPTHTTFFVWSIFLLGKVRSDSRLVLVFVWSIFLLGKVRSDSRLVLVRNKCLIKHVKHHIL
jgi:hypothetical protein